MVRGLKKSSPNTCKKTFITLLAITLVAVLLLGVRSQNGLIILNPNPDGDGFTV